jgi:hypothetical protein
MQVCGRKARGPENLLRFDIAAFKEVTKESRDVSGLGAREVLVAWDVLVLATRGCWAAVMAAIIATVLTTAELAGARLVNHRESEVLVIIEVVQDRGVSLGEGFSLRGRNSRSDKLYNILDSSHRMLHWRTRSWPSSHNGQPWPSPMSDIFKTQRIPRV